MALVVSHLSSQSVTLTCHNQSHSPVTLSCHTHLSRSPVTLTCHSSSIRLMYSLRSHRWQNSWRLSLNDLLLHIDLGQEFAWRRQLFAEIAQSKVRETIVNRAECSLLPLYKSISTDQPEHCYSILEVLDKGCRLCYLDFQPRPWVCILELSLPSILVTMEAESPGIAARALANIADVLGCMAGPKGGLRSGPSGNIQWKHAYEFLEVIFHTSIHIAVQ